MLDYKKMIDKAVEESVKKRELEVLFATNTKKQETTSIEDIKNAIQQINKTQVILININIRWWFERILWAYRYSQELTILMWVEVINYPIWDLYFYLNWALEKYDEIIWIPKEWEVYIIDSKKILDFNK